MSEQLQVLLSIPPVAEQFDAQVIKADINITARKPKASVIPAMQT